MKFEINIKVNLFVKICQSKREEIAFNHDNNFFQKCLELLLIMIIQQIESIDYFD